ncbi:MAG: P1 family peptidase [Eubacteriales bacterium]|jgi:L-aminopeptidase/D-esterase-like protein|nr:P1 family peptidase [Eubacteriales bacterium]MDD3289413.1 P1 family peptidase [Eubacteriales bacterium]MDD3863716.1 P1 family peptidase [Eubacteriales bacterium]MDD4444579.1 P1 family peptidase [Eubacteriales bacterium]
MKGTQVIDIRSIGDVFIGQAENATAGTGCTVIISPRGAVGGVDVRGGGPATRETDLLDPVNMVESVFAVILSGGSAYGLDAAGGVMRFLEEQKIGFPVGEMVVPIVCGASLFDLMTGDGSVRPDAAMGYEACKEAFAGATLMEGNHGAGTGATVGKYMGPERMMKSGIGHYALQAGDLKVGAIVAVNALGDVIDCDSRRTLAGVLSEDTDAIDDTCSLVLENQDSEKDVFSGNTTIGCVLTNARLTKPQAGKLAAIAQNGYADVIRPVHTMADGDTIFTMALGQVDADPLAVGILAREAVARAINRAVCETRHAYGLKCASDFKTDGQ